MAKQEKKKAPKQAVAKKDKVINLNFYQLQLENLKPHAENAETIRAAFKAPPEAFRSLPNLENDSRISLKGRALVAEENGIVYGTLIHTQTKDLPLVSNDISDTYEELKIAPDAGLGVPTSFLFDPEVNIVMVESVQGGVGMGAFCRFFEMNLTLQSLTGAIVINPIELKKLNSMQRIVKLQYKVARLQTGNHLKDEKNAVGRIIEAADDTNNDIMEVTLASSRSKKSSLALDVTKGMIETIRKYTSKDNKDVKKLLVTGTIDGFTDQVDLIKQRVKSEIRVELSRNNSIASISERYKALYSAYVDHKHNLHQAYKE